MKYLTIFLLLVFSFTVEAQNCSLNFSSGLTSSNTNDNYSLKMDSYLGLYTNLFFESSENNFGYRLGYELNINKAFMDFMSCQRGPVYYHDNEYTVYLLNLPVLLKYSIGEKMKFYFLGGLFIDFNIYSRWKCDFEYYSFVTGTMVTEPIDKKTDGFEFLNVGITTGFGFEVPGNTRMNYFIEVKQNIYANILATCNNLEQFGNMKSLNFSLGIKYNLKKPIKLLN